MIEPSNENACFISDKDKSEPSALPAPDIPYYLDDAKVDEIKERIWSELE